MLGGLIPVINCHLRGERCPGRSEPHSYLSAQLLVRIKCLASLERVVVVLTKLSVVSQNSLGQPFRSTISLAVPDKEEEPEGVSPEDEEGADGEGWADVFGRPC